MFIRNTASAGLTNNKIGELRSELETVSLYNDDRTLKYDKKIMQDILACTIKEITQYNAVIEAIMEHNPLYIDESLPQTAVETINNTGSPAFAMPGMVCFSTKQFVETYNQELKKALAAGAGATSKQKEIISQCDKGHWSELIYEMEVIIRHEYAHILLRHSQKRLQVLRRTFTKQQLEADAGKITSTPTFRATVFAAECDANDSTLVTAVAGTAVKQWEGVISKADFLDTVPDIDKYNGFDNLYTLFKNILKKQDNKAKELEQLMEQLAERMGEQEMQRIMEQIQQGEPEQSASAQEFDKQLEQAELESAQQSKTKAKIDDTDQETDQLADQETNQPADNDEMEHDYSHPGRTFKLDKTYNSLVSYAVMGVIERNKCLKALKNIKSMITGDFNSKSKTFRRQTYSRASRKTSDGGILRRGVKTIKKGNPKVLLALDTSGSMSGTTTKKAATAMTSVVKIMPQLKKTMGVCIHESSPSDILPIKQLDKILAEFKPGGGNNFTAVLIKAIRHGYETVLNVGDGEDYIASLQDIINKMNAGYCSYSDRELSDWVKTEGKEVVIKKLKDAMGETPDRQKIIWVDVIITPSSESVKTSIEDLSRNGIKRIIIDISKLK